MASSRKAKKIELIPKGFLEDLDERKKYDLLKECYLSPVADSVARKVSINDLAATLKREDRGTLANIAAISMLGMLEWRMAFINYVGSKLVDPNLSYEHRFAIQELADEAKRAAEGHSRGGKNQAANSPKALAKDKTFEFWNERRAGKHPKLRTNEQFAIECMRRWSVLTSAKVICGWCTEWNKAAKKSQPAS